MNKIQSAIDKAREYQTLDWFVDFEIIEHFGARCMIRNAIKFQKEIFKEYEKAISLYQQQVDKQDKEMKKFMTLMNNQLESRVKKIDKLEKENSKLFSTIIGEEPLKLKVDRLTVENEKLKKKNPYYKELQRLIKEY